ncbi:MAG: hypothetical protein MJB12_14470 [Firmicutes bacterium]|nr:hypothetical protein [Bacillota bacterium]
MNRKKRDEVINKLLFVTIFSILASVILSLIYRGYMHTAYILMMPGVMLGIFILSAAAAGIMGWRIYKSNQKMSSRLFPYFLISIIFAVSSLLVRHYILYAIYALWILIAIYLVVSFVYYIYKLTVK